MTPKASFQDHWVNIEPERMERYEAMFRWNPATAPFFAGAKIGEGHSVGDFGCGPGHTAIEFARWVGPSGHVHAFDVNAEFIKRVGQHAAAQGVADRITAHLLVDERLPLHDGSLDRIVARNTMVYVADPRATFAEFRRVLKSGGIAHAIEGDWRLTAVEPVPTSDWRELIEAASWAWPHPEIGRSLHGCARRAGFADVSIQVLTNPDTSGRLTGMIQNVAAYARSSGKMESARIDRILSRVDEGLAHGAYLAIVPQFVLTAVV
jgi:SAM-dependent methyltransferase